MAHVLARARQFGLHVQAWETINEVFGQLVIIALPEEAFYRGYSSPG